MDITVDDYDHGLLLLAVAELSLRRPEYAARLERIARNLQGHRMFKELQDLRLRQNGARPNGITRTR